MTTFTFKFDFEQRVRHRLSNFEGHVIGICVHPRPSAVNCTIEYLVLPTSDDPNVYYSAVWVDSTFLESAEPPKPKRRTVKSKSINAGENANENKEENNDERN
jgi:hypothetical protein